LAVLRLEADKNLCPLFGRFGKGTVDDAVRLPGKPNRVNPSAAYGRNQIIFKIDDIPGRLWG
jgi:hypothetical protein